MVHSSIKITYKIYFLGLRLVHLRLSLFGLGDTVVRDIWGENLKGRGGELKGSKNVREGSWKGGELELRRAGGEGSWKRGEMEGMIN